jgi:hypothetical protein
MSPLEIEVRNLNNWSQARLHIDDYPDALETERCFLDRMVEMTRERLTALGNLAVAPLTVLMGEEGQGEL